MWKFQVDAAAAAARAFLAAVGEWEDEAEAEEQRQAEDWERRQQAGYIPAGEGNPYVGKRVSKHGGTRRAGDLRRRSMDLTRALAELRSGA